MNALTPEANPQPPAECRSTTLALYNPDPDKLEQILELITTYEEHRGIKIVRYKEKPDTVWVTFKIGFYRDGDEHLLRQLCRECNSFSGTKVEIE